jgi:hypothetical protein
MSMYTDEELLSFCLGDAPEEMRRNIARLSADDQAFRRRLFQIQTITLAMRTAPDSRMKSVKKKRYIFAGAVAATTGCFLAGMLLQAQIDFFKPALKKSDQSMFEEHEISAPFSWEGRAERVL